jgi:hypothetical protein
VGTRVLLPKTRVALLEAPQDLLCALGMQVLSEDIVPALEKLRKEKQLYNEWQDASSKLDRLKRFVIAHNYMEAEKCEGRAMRAVQGIRM